MTGVEAYRAFTLSRVFLEIFKRLAQVKVDQNSTAIDYHNVACTDVTMQNARVINILVSWKNISADPKKTREDSTYL